MALAAVLKRLRTLAPLVAAGVAVTTLLLCVLSNRLGARYTGGLAWPYLSDLVRDAPAYYAFALGATAVAALLALNWAFNFELQRAVLLDSGDGGCQRLPVAAARLLRATVALGALSTPGLALLALFSAASFPTTHSAAALWFLLLQSVAVFLNTFVSYKIHKFVRSMADPLAFTLPGVSLTPPPPETPRHRRLQRTFHTQFVCAAAFFVAMLLYLPVGLAIVQPAKRLSVQECLERALGADYCERVVRHDDVDTELWNFEDDVAAHQMRAFAQLGVAVTLLAYAVSFAAHDYDAEVDRLVGRGLAHSTHFYSLAVLPTPPPATATSATTATTASTAMTLHDSS